MNEYIDRKKAIKAACEALELFPSEEQALETALKNVPTEDVIEVCRCHKCKFYKMVYSLDEEDGMRCIREKYTRKIKPDDFCSYGKREEK